MFADVSFRQGTTMRYGEDIIEVTRQKFQKCTNRLHEMVVDRDDVEHVMWIVSAPSCAMSCINDGLYLPGNEAPVVE